MTTAFASRIERANYYHLVMDIAWFGLAAAATSRFLQFFAIRMGATPMEIGWITALPALVLLFATSLSAWWRSRHEDSIHAVWYPSIGFRLIFILPAFAPFFPSEWRTVWLIAAATLPALPQAISSTVFLVMVRETVAPRNLTPLFTRRALAMNITVTLGALIFGFLLEWLPFPLNYQVMFVMAFIFSMISQWHLGRLHIVADLLPEMPVTTTPPKFIPQRSFRDLVRDTNFLSVAYIVLVTHIAFFSIFAVIPLRLENDLGAGEGFFALYGVVELLAGAGTTMIIGRVIEHRGSRFALVMAMFMTGVGGLILAVAPNATFTLIAAALTGSGWTSVGIATLGFFSERTQAQDMKATQFFHQMIFGAMFVGPLLGSILADSGMALTAIMLMGAGLRFLAAFLTHQGLALFTGRKVEPLSAS